MTRTLCWIAHRDSKDPQSGGAERSTFEICRELARHGWEVQLIVGGFPRAPREEWLGEVKVIRGSGPVSLHLELPELMRAGQPADVIVEDLSHVVPFAVERITQSPGVVFFRHLHRRTLAGQVGTPLRLLLTAIEASYPLVYQNWPLVAPSRSALADLVSLGFDKKRLHLIGYGVDLQSFKPATLTDTPSLIYFSGLRRYKRAQHALLALNLLRSQGMDANLVVVGRGPELSSLLRLSRQLGLEGHVSFTGWISDLELGALISKSWVHVQCSMAEGWGLTAWEAAASGVPTAAYSVPGLMDSVVPGVTGILVDDGDISALARAIAIEIRTRTEWTSRCRKAVSDHSWPSVAAEWDSFLRLL